MKITEIHKWLRESRPNCLEELWRTADDVRRNNVGDAVHLRALIEFSNHCIRHCGYCGLRGANRRIVRYRMSADEIVQCAVRTAELGYGTVVLQSGEDDSMTANWLAELIRRIKTSTPLAVTLSVGERPETDLATWRQAGADRYLLRFETSDRTLFERIHPPQRNNPCDRIGQLGILRRLGYEVGSGVMIGIPGQGYASLAHDIAMFAKLNLDMIGVGPFIAHPDTPMGGTEASLPAPDGQVPNTEMMTYKVIALTRLVCPQANIPATTALATLNKVSGRELGLSRGANVVMPNMTPQKYRAMYEIYPAKACLSETPAECNTCMRSRIHSIGRTVGTGRGDSPNYLSVQCATGRS